MMSESRNSAVKNRKFPHVRANALMIVTFSLLTITLFLPHLFQRFTPTARAASTELFISEYIEGSSNNKAIEIFNDTGASINLGTGGYNVQMFFNGSATAGLTINLVGTVANGDVFVLAQSSANATILAQADQTNSSGWFNGDDAVVLRKGTTIIDSIGQVGFDPGTEWGTGLVSTADNTLQRKAGVCAGDTDATNVFDPGVEWTGFATDNITGLGSHSCGAATPTPTATPTPSPTPLSLKINQIQGSGSVSPVVGQFINTSGIVTAKKTNGFFLQEPDASVDLNINTSEGVFVFTSAAPSVNVGDLVNVTGNAVEFNGLTEITINNGSINVVTVGQTLPSPIVLTTSILNPAGTVDQLERFEGMRLSAAVVRSVAPTNGFGEIFTVLDGVARPMREPGIDILDPVPPDPTSGIVDCCIPRWDHNPERIMIDTDGLAGSSVLDVTSNVTLTSVLGPLDFAFGDYRIDPETAPVVATPNMTAVPVRAASGTEFSIAGYNIENFANGTTQRRKAALAIRTVMNMPDVIGTIEILNLASLQALATQVNNDAVIAGDPDPGYVAYLIDAPLGGTQNVGYLVKSSRVQVLSVTQERGDETYINPLNNQAELLHDRPPLVLKAVVNPSIDPRPIIVVVNHLRSFISIDLVGGDGIRVRAKRKAQAESTAGLLQELQGLNPGTPVISVGDYNSYQFSDGYTDPIKTIKGLPTVDGELVVDASPDLVSPDFVNLIDTLPTDEQYSFMFEGTPQALDHIIINEAANSIVKDFGVARSNADFPETVFVSDASVPFNNSDHDSPIAIFQFPKRETTTSVSNVDVTYNVGGQNINLAATVATDPNSVNEGTVTFTIKAQDGSIVGTAGPVNVTNGNAASSFFLPGSVAPQALQIIAEFSGGDTTLPSSGTGTLTVKYAVCGLYDQTRSVRSGAAYPIKLQLCDVNGVNVSSSSIAVKATSINLVSAPDSDLEVTDAGNANPDNNFRFDASLAGYIFNLKTTGLASGVYQLNFTAGLDPTEHSVQFKVK